MYIPALEVASYAGSSLIGFWFLTRNVSTIDKILTGLGYFPLMIIVFYGEALYVSMSLPGARGNF